MNKEIITEFETTLSEFITTLSSFSQEQFNTHPFEGSWTAGQVGEHVRKSLKRGVVLLTTNTKPSERPPDQLIEEIKNLFLNFSTKIKSPEFIIPAEMNYNKDILIQELSGAKEIGKVAKPLDLSELCLSFAFPVLGHLTRLEIIHFYTYHTQRHIHQLKNIAEKLRDQINMH